VAGCRIVFGATSEGKTSVDLPDLDAETVGKRLLANPDGFERFDYKKGSLWINVRNVFWVEDKGDARMRAL
jgi:hypothetical protein